MPIIETVLLSAIDVSFAVGSTNSKDRSSTFSGLKTAKEAESGSEDVLMGMESVSSVLWSFSSFES